MKQWKYGPANRKFPFESNLESNQGVPYMFNADCRVGVVYLIMWKPTTLLHATLYVLFFLSVL